MEEQIFIKEYGSETFETSAYVKKLQMFEEKCKPSDRLVTTDGDILQPMLYTYMTMKCPHGTFEKFKSQDQKNGNEWSEFFPKYSLRSHMERDRISSQNQVKAMNRLHKEMAPSKGCQIM